MRNVRSPKSNNRKTNEPQRNWRIYALTFAMLFVSCGIIGKLYFLQVHASEEYREIADKQHQMRSPIVAQRGEVFMQDEIEPYPLAVNQQLMMAYAVPREIRDVKTTVEGLSQVLGIEYAELSAKLDKPEDMYEVLKKKLSDEEVQKIRDLKFPGIYLQPETYRYYPAGELAAQIVGYVGSDGNEFRGMYGLESFWDEELKGKAGMLSQKGDARGRWISVSDRQIDPAENGSDLILTINHTVQYEVEKILKDSLEKYAADKGSIVVMEARTGKLLAIANSPGFDPNQYSKTEDISNFSNAAVSQAYESGSVFKPITSAIGIDAGVINPDTTYVDTGEINEAGFSIHNSDMKANGVQTMTEVLEKSLNTGVIYIEKLVGNKTFADYVKRFGFGEKTGIELPNEAAGNIRNLENTKVDINFFTISFGQGITTTPLQLAAAYGALANGGTLMKPQIIDAIKHRDGSIEKREPQEVRQVVSKETARLIGGMLRSVVVNGHGKRADVPGYQVGGKTGTAQVAKVGSKGYEEGINIGSFTGYAPINDPQFVVVVALNNPKNVEWAESSAAPTFGEVMKFLLEYYHVKPTEDPETSPLAKMAPLPQNQTESVVDTAANKDENSKDKDKDKDKKN